MAVPGAILATHKQRNLTENLPHTTQAVITLWDIRYTVPDMNKWLHRNGFSYKKPVGVLQNGSRTCLNLMGALNPKDIGSTIIREYNAINSENIARFFITIRETYPVAQKLHIILDGARYHRNERVKEWTYVMNIELHYLPPYNPNLNPIERLWKVMNEEVRNNRYFASAREFRQEIHRFFSNKLPSIARALSCRINDNFQTLKNATSG